MRNFSTQFHFPQDLQVSEDPVRLLHRPKACCCPATERGLLLRWARAPVRVGLHARWSGREQGDEGCSVHLLAWGPSGWAVHHEGQPRPGAARTEIDAHQVWGQGPGSTQMQLLQADQQQPLNGVIDKKLLLGISNGFGFPFANCFTIWSKYLIIWYLCQ